MFRKRARGSVMGLTRAAAMVALVGLATFAFSMFYPRPLVVIFSMSAGHLIGVLAVGLYLLAVVLDTIKATNANGGVAPSPDAAADTSEVDDD